MSDILKITPKDLISVAGDAVGPADKSSTRTAIDGLKGRLKVRKTRLGPSTPIRMATGPVPPNPEPDLEIKLSTGASRESRLPDDNFVGLLKSRRQRLLPGSPLGSACIPNSAAVAIARAGSQIPLGEVETAQWLIDSGVELGVGGYYNIFQTGDALLRSGTVSGLIALSEQTKQPVQDLSKVNFEQILTNHGSVLLCDQVSAHAAALIGWAKPGDVVGDETVTEPMALMYNGLPGSEIGGVPPNNPGEILTWVKATQLATMVNNHNGEYGMQGMVFMPPAAPEVA
jgi:hypothetical protein